MSILGSSAVSDTAFIKEIAHKIAECAPCSGNKGGAPRSFEAIVFDVGKQGENYVKASAGGFDKFVNTRCFEMIVTDLVRSVVLSETDIDDLKLEIKNSVGKNDGYAFSVFFILFSWLRRHRFQSLEELYADYGKYFAGYPIDAHIRGLILVNGSPVPAKIKKAIDEIGMLIKSKSDEYDFSKHCGVLNLYTELICKYFEVKLDERDNDENKGLLSDAYKHINSIIREYEINSGGNAYPKFYLMKGRVLTLLKRYDEGEDCIRKAISLIPIADKDRHETVAAYSQYLITASMIRAFDMNAEKYGEMEKIKSENSKAITLIMAIAGFLLGGINIFAKVESTVALLTLMIGYFGLVILLTGIVLLGFTLSDKKKGKGKSIAYSVVIMTVGLAVFVVSLVLCICKVVA